MAETLTESYPAQLHTQRLAWGVMLLSFAVFCVIVIFVIVGVRYYVFQSRVPMQAIVQSARGTATLISTADLQEIAVTKPRELTNSAVLTTDPQTQASLSFYDQQRADSLTATVTLKPGSSLNLKEESRPRFDVSQESYWIDFEDAYGEFDIFVPAGLGRPILITFETTLGPSAWLSASGRYKVVAAGSQVVVSNYSGEALLMLPERHTQSIPAGQSASMQVSDAPANAVTIAPALVNLLGDAALTENNVVDYNAVPDENKALVWRCNNTQITPPAGSFGLVEDDGRTALRLFRGSNTESHGETRCVQGLGSGTAGLDVSMFNHVSIRATFKIVSQSLSVCGVDGSECPLMLAMDYIPASGDCGTDLKNCIWYHGFYAFADPNRAFPYMCPSCNEQHEAVNPGAWYVYESRSFLDMFAPDQRPKSILNLRFYASGHDYEVYVSEIALLVDQGEIPLPVLGG